MQFNLRQNIVYFSANMKRHYNISEILCTRTRKISYRFRLKAHTCVVTYGLVEMHWRTWFPGADGCDCQPEAKGFEKVSIHAYRFKARSHLLALKRTQTQSFYVDRYAAH